MWSPQRNKERNRCLLNRQQAHEVGRESSWGGGEEGRSRVPSFFGILQPSWPQPPPALQSDDPEPLAHSPTGGGTSPSIHGTRATMARLWDYVVQSVSPACTCMKLQPPRESANNGEDNHQSKAMASTWQCPFKGTRYK